MLCLATPIKPQILSLKKYFPEPEDRSDSETAKDQKKEIHSEYEITFLTIKLRYLQSRLKDYYSKPQPLHS
jgi:hypothetical protein